MERIGYTLNRLLEERGWKPADLSRAANVNRAHVTVYTSGRKAIPKLDLAAQLCKALGIGLDVFWYECLHDFRTEGYARWMRMADKRFGRGEYAERDPSQETDPAHEVQKMVAGEGVEPPTQGFSGSRPRRALSLRSYSVEILNRYARHFDYTREYAICTEGIGERRESWNTVHSGRAR